MADVLLVRWVKDNRWITQRSLHVQGLVAGLNAARRAQELAPVIIPRHTSYIGTLIDDLVTKVRIRPKPNISLHFITAPVIKAAASVASFICNGSPVAP